MKRFLPVALALAAPAHGQEAAATVSPQQVTALRSYFACIYEQVVQLDDGASDPAALTPKVAPTCRYLLGAAATIFAHGDPTERETWYKKWLALEEAQVAKTVWAVRIERRASSDPAPVVAAATPAAPPVQLADTQPRAPHVAAARPKPVAAKPADAKPMSEWRRAYIAKHGHEPPVAAK